MFQTTRFISTVVRGKVEVSSKRGDCKKSTYYSTLSRAFWKTENGATASANTHLGAPSWFSNAADQTAVLAPQVGIEKAQVDSSRGVFVALGSNVGDRVAAIEAACQAIDGDNDMKVVRTSALYETEPMYVKDQDRFLNGVCEVSHLRDRALSSVDSCRLRRNWRQWSF